jgi:Spy/CpxP family protein refolding chaperone
MGANQSQEQKVQSVPTSQDNQADGQSVSFSGHMIEKGISYDHAIEQKLQEAYQKGKSDGISTIQHTLSEVASQTFDQINNQLSEMQSKHIDHSKQMVRIDSNYSSTYTCMYIFL